MSQSTWNIDPQHSSITFSVRHMAFAKVRGRFSSWSGSLRWDPEDPASARVSVSVDAASIDTGVADRDAHLRSGDFLDVDSFPQFHFEAKRIEPAGEGQFKLSGDVTIKGTTREVVLDVHHGGRARDPWGYERAAFEATARIDRRDFGLTWNQTLETGGILVGHEVAIEIELQAVKEEAAAAS